MKRVTLLKSKTGLVCVLIVCLTCILPNRSFANETRLWESLGSGKAIALMRHALAPGTGDPAAFSLDDCSTQRVLSTEGHDQAKRIGLRFKENNIDNAKVFSSQWCRCMDTATALDLGEVKSLAILNSFFQDPQLRSPQTQSLITWIANQNHTAPVILVTHQVNITALTGIFPTSGEAVFIRLADDEVDVLGTIKTD